MINLNGETPELKEMSDIDFRDWWKNSASNPLNFFTGRCPHCGSNNVTMLIKHREMNDSYDGKTYPCFESAQVLCNNCSARGGMYERNLLRTPERPKMQASENWSVVQYGIAMWNNRGY